MSPDLPAEDIHLTPKVAGRLAYMWAEWYEGPHAYLTFDVPLDVDAATQRGTAGVFDIYFQGWGCTLALLAHEFAHCAQDWDDPEEHGAEHDALQALIECQLRELL